MKAAYCLGFVEGLRRGIMATQTSTWNKPCCQPEDITNLQTVRIVRKFIADNPEPKNSLSGWQSKLFTKHSLAPGRRIGWRRKVFHQAKFQSAYGKSGINRKHFVA